MDTEATKLESGEKKKDPSKWAVEIEISIDNILRGGKTLVILEVLKERDSDDDRFIFVRQYRGNGSFWLLTSPFISFWWTVGFIVMILKRQFVEEGSENSPLSNQSQSPTPKLRKVVNRVLKDLYLQEFTSEICVALEPVLRRVVKEELDALMFQLRSSPRHSLIHQPDSSSASRTLQLCFVKKLPSPLFTNTAVRDVDHTFLKIKLIDASSKNLIWHSPLSSIKVEVLVLSADFSANGREDWTEAEFNQSIVREREGKRPLLVGEITFSLVNGSGTIENVVFTDNSSWVRSRQFRLAVRALPSPCMNGIREAVSEPFVVLDHRGESYQKHDTPSLDDPVWRLKKISKNGQSHKKLASLGINTVKDFLMHYHINPSYLRDALGKGVPNRAWETMVKHANECPLDDTLYSYYQPVDSLDASQKALVDELKKVALLNENQLVTVHNGSVSNLLLASSTTPLNMPFSGAGPDLHHDGLSFIDQDGPKQLDFNISEGYPQEDDLTPQSNQHVQDINNCLQINPIISFKANNEFLEEPSCPQIPTFNGFLSASSSSTHTLNDIFQKLPNSGLNRKRKAGWCKIRAALMWKIVRRDVASRKEAELRFCYY